MRDRGGIEAGRYRVVYLAMFAPLVLLLVIAATTWRAERRYAAVTERVIHDYAAIAAWQYARRANAGLHDETMAAFRAIGSTSRHQLTAAGAMLPPERILGGADSGSAILAGARLAFSYDARADSLVTTDRALDGPTRDMLRRITVRISRRPDGDTDPHRMLFDTAAGAAHAIALWTVVGPNGANRGAYGIVSDPAALSPRLRRVVEGAPLIPSTNAAARVTADDLAIRLTHRDRAVFSAGDAPGRTAATDTSGMLHGDVRVTVDVPRRLASTLLVGTAPTSQLPALAVMIALAATLATIGVAQQRRARELARLRERFVANVSHELRTPLTQISMFAETLMHGRERTEAERRQFVTVIYAEARRLTTLVESVLRFSRGGSRAVRPRPEMVSLRSEIESAIEAFDPIARAAGAQVSLEGEDIEAPVDPGGFRQIILNLLDNAVKHGGRGTRVVIGMHRVGDEARITVDDSGPGIPESWRRKVFEPFVRIEQGNAAGAGIGLAVVRDIVHAHRGEVLVESAPIGGARIVVSLPLSRPAPAGSPRMETGAVA